AGRFQPHAHRLGQLPVKSFGFSIRVHQLPLLNLSDFCIHPSDLLKTGMIITTYNDHVKAPSFPVVLCLQTKNTVSDRAFAFIQSTLSRFLRGWGCSTPAIRGCIFKSYACLFL